CLPSPPGTAPARLRGVRWNGRRSAAVKLPWSFEPQFHRPGMRGHTLGMGKAGGGGADLAQSFLAYLDETGALHEIQHREPAGKPCAAPGGQHVVRPGDVIAHGFGSVAAEKDAASMTQIGENRLRIF